MFKVNHQWDKLDQVILGKSYGPEFYRWIKNKKVRHLFEKIATETEDDYQNIKKTLESFNINVIRPSVSDFPDDNFINGQYVPPPMFPRDYTAMIHNTFYENYSFSNKSFYNTVKQPNWVDYINDTNSNRLVEQHPDYNKAKELSANRFSNVFDYIKKQGNTIKSHVEPEDTVNGAQVTIMGDQLYFGTANLDCNLQDISDKINNEFPLTKNNIINTGGHSDGTFCPVAPGLIVSLFGEESYKKSFPDWEVIYLKNQSWNAIPDWTLLKQKNFGKWWIPEYETDSDVINTVNTWLDTWVGYVEETVFDVNMLVVDPSNVLVFSYNKQVFDALERYNITPHICNFRHRYFWDGGIHCVTSDLNRKSANLKS